METNKNYTPQEYDAAVRSVNKKMGFYVHLSVYLIVNGFFHILNLVQGEDYWAFWPAMGWGIGLFFHGVNTFGISSNSEWKNRQIEKEIERQRKNRNFGV